MKARVLITSGGYGVPYRSKGYIDAWTNDDHGELCAIVACDCGVFILAQIRHLAPIGASPDDHPRLIGWRTENYLWETASRDMAKSWEPNIGVLPIFEGDPNTTLTAPAADNDAPASTAIIRALVEHIERNTCEHESTYRGGTNWTICESCGARWADDQGGKPEFQWPAIVIEAREFLRGAK